MIGFWGFFVFYRNYVNFVNWSWEKLEQVNMNGPSMLFESLPELKLDCAVNKCYLSIRTDCCFIYSYTIVDSLFMSIENSDYNRITFLQYLANKPLKSM